MKPIGGEVIEVHHYGIYPRHKPRLGWGVVALDDDLNKLFLVYECDDLDDAIAHLKELCD